MKSKKRFLVKQNGVLRELCTVAQDNHTDPTVRVSFNMGQYVRSLTKDLEWSELSNIKENKFSVHPSEKASPPAFIITHKVGSKGFNKRGFIRVSKNPKTDLYFIPICYLFVGNELPEFSDNPENSIVLSDYDSDQDIMFAAVSACSKKIIVKGTSDIGSRCFDFDKFRINVNFTFFKGRSSIKSYQVVPYTIHPDAPKLPFQENFNPITISELEYLSIGEKIRDFSTILSLPILTSGDPFFKISEMPPYAFPVGSFRARRDYKNLETFDMIKKRQIEFLPETGHPLIDIGYPFDVMKSLMDITRL